MCTPSHNSVTTDEIAAAIAALTTPSLGSPNHPWISAGVTTSPIAVEIASAHRGVTVSPTPRIIAVASKKVKVAGIAIIMMRA